MRMRRKVIAVMLTLIFTMSLCIPGIAAENTDIEAFVTRFYVQILNRQPDEAGLAAWSDNLRTGREAGANVGYGFIQSIEFQNRNLSNEDYIKVLYRAFFDREADAAGLNAWLGVLDSGLSRLHVYRGFAESVEFSEVCSRYGIIRGNVTLTAPMDQNENVTKFVVRCYRLCLDRNADDDGLNGWCSQIISGANSAKEAAHGFVFSNEFKNKNLSNTEYVKVLYRVFMDREADGGGLDAWVKVLENGKSREHVFNGFADSAEFRALCAQYGIYAGEPTPEEPDESWKNVYVKAINEYIESNSTTGTFGLFDINRDGIPELILTAHFGGGGTNIENTVYTVKNNSLYKMKEGLGGILNGYSKNGVNTYTHNMTGNFSTTSYIWDGNHFIELGYVSGILDNENSNKYYLGDNYTNIKEVSKNIFEAYISEKAGEYVLINYEPCGDIQQKVTVDNIDTYVTK